jgi:hypothetical protein
MENQHQKITGYRDLTQQEIDAMNKVKEAAAGVGDSVAALRQVPELDQRWVSIGATELQQGFMALVRAIAKPRSRFRWLGHPRCEPNFRKRFINEAAQLQEAVF